MSNLDVILLEELPLHDLETLLIESRQQGFEFLDRLVSEYEGDINRFSGPNEALFAVYDEQSMIAIGGLNADPYLREDGVGRVRHLYVLSAWRRQGVGKLLVSRIIERARVHYRTLTLRTFSAEADKFYRVIVFQTEPVVEGATHYLILDSG